MELRTYLQIINRRKLIIILTILLITSIATALTLLATPIYVTSTTLRVATVGVGVNGGRADLSYTERLMNTYARIITGGSIKQDIRERLKINSIPPISVNLLSNTELMSIAVESSDPVIAKDVANTVAQIIIDKSLELYGGSGATTADILLQQVEKLEIELQNSRDQYEQFLATPDVDQSRLDATHQSIQLKEQTYLNLLEQYENTRINTAFLSNLVTVIEEATLPTQPSKPRVVLNILLGLIGSIVAGMLMAFVVENLDARLHSVDQVESMTELPTIGEIPMGINHQGNGILQLETGNQPLLEAFRRLRVNILAAQTEPGCHVIMITSARKGEGKSSVTSNVALTLSQSGRRVIVIDCDLHEPVQHKLLGIPNRTGLSDYLIEQETADIILQNTSYPRLGLVPSGPALPEAREIAGTTSLTETALIGRIQQGAELLGSKIMADLIKSLKDEADVILLDTPPLLTSTDAAVLVPLVDDVIVVISQGDSRRDEIKTLHNHLLNARAKSIGIVVNRI